MTQISPPARPSTPAHRIPTGRHQRGQEALDSGLVRACLRDKAAPPTIKKSAPVLARSSAGVSPRSTTSSAPSETQAHDEREDPAELDEIALQSGAQSSTDPAHHATWRRCSISS